MIRATNIKKGRINRKQLLRLKSQTIPLSRDPYLKTGDIIVVRSGAYTGDVAMITPEWTNSVAGYDLILSPSNVFDSFFCTQYLLSDTAQSYFKSQRDRSAQPHLNSHQLANTIAVLPPLKEQQKVSAILYLLDRKIDVEENRNQVLAKCFNTLLQDLMTGKIRVNNIEVKES